MTSYRSTRTDENAPFDRAGSIRLVGAKKDALTSTQTATRRPALGDLVNRALKSNNIIDPKKTIGQSENENNAGTVIDLKKIKPRVDTHWAKTAQQPIRKIVTRSSSLRSTSNGVGQQTTTAITNALPSNSIAGNGPKLLRTKTTTTAQVREVKYITSTKAFVRTDKSKSPEKPMISSNRSKIRTASTSSTTVSIKSGSITSKVGIDNGMRKEQKVSYDANVVEQQAVISAVADSTNDKAEFKFIQNELVSDVHAHSSNMLHEFNNIDADDEYNPLLVSEYVNDIYSYLYHLERTYAIKGRHLDGQRDVFPKMRSVLIDWINEVHFQYRFQQETFHMTVSIIDRYLQAVKTTSRQNLQLVGVAALFIASKYEELYPPEVRDFVYITDDTYTKHEVIEMEKHILKKLKFELGCPLSIHFLRRYSKAALSQTSTHVMSKYFIELAAVDYELCKYLPSEIAAASVFIALCLSSNITTSNGTVRISIKKIDYNAIWTSSLQFYTTYTLPHLKPCIKRLAEYIMSAPKAKLNNVYTKYCSVKFNETAVTTANSARLLEDICLSL